MRVALAGPMGAGKSTVGRLLADRLQVPFVDLDKEIGDVAKIFAVEGEAGFRVRETEALRACVGGEGVIALGGGTVVDPGNRTLLAGWQVFVLMGTFETLKTRIGGGIRKRPLVSKLEALLAERAEAYAAAGERIDTDGLSAEEVTGQVAAACASR